jgi:hypothetical protein
LADHLIQFPSNWRYLDQFAHTRYAPKPSLMLCGECSTAMAAELAYPGRWIPEELVAQLCQKWTGKADDVSNNYGTTTEEVKSWLDANHIGYIDLQNLVDEFNHGNKDPLRHQLGYMNSKGIPQIITVVDEEPIYEAVPNPNNDPNTPYVRGPKLHPWAKPKEYSHVMFRVGYSDSEGYGLYADPAAAAFCENKDGSFKPVKILWSDIEEAGVMHCLAVMPSGVTAESWDKPPKPELDVAQLAQSLVSLGNVTETAIERIRDAANSLQDEERLLEAKKGEVDRLVSILKQVSPNIQL